MATLKMYFSADTKKCCRCRAFSRIKSETKQFVTFDEPDNETNVLTTEVTLLYGSRGWCYFLWTVVLLLANEHDKAERVEFVDGDKVTTLYPLRPTATS